MNPNQNCDDFSHSTFSPELTDAEKEAHKAADSHGYDWKHNRRGSFLQGYYHAGRGETRWVDFEDRDPTVTEAYRAGYKAKENAAGR